MYKIKPTLDYMKLKCLSVLFNESLSIVGKMCFTKARRRRKMFTKNKQHKERGGEIGYCHKIVIYSLEETEQNFNLWLFWYWGYFVWCHPSPKRSNNRPKLQDQFWQICVSYTYIFMVRAYMSKKVPHSYSEENITSIESADISNILHRDSCNLCLLGIFIG